MLIVQMFFTGLAVASAIFVFTYRNKQLRSANKRLAEYEAEFALFVQPIPPGAYTTQDRHSVIEVYRGAVLRLDWKGKRWYMEDGHGKTYITDKSLGFFPVERLGNPYTLVDGVD